MGLFDRLKKGLTKTSQALSDVVTRTQKLTPETLDALETALIQADVGLGATENILQELQKRTKPEDDAQENLAHIITQKLTPLQTTLHLTPTPHVILMVGVNGSGKTTTTAKLAEYYQTQGKSVHLAAADTFRAGAVEQLATWAKRTKTPITLPQSTKTDPAALTYRAVEEALTRKTDLLIIDTAGRLTNNTNLMAELTKIRTTITKHLPEEHITTLLVLDGTAGQNALTQYAQFNAATPINGLIITKLDSAAKGGILLALTAHNNCPPVPFISTGETTDNLHPFNPESYTKALLTLA